MKRGQYGFVLLGSAALAWGGLFALGACGSDTGSTSDTTPPLPDSGGTKDTGTPTDAGTDTSTPGDAGADCGKAAELHVEKADGGMFCPFSALTTGGKDIYCASTDQCCETPSGTSPSTCVTRGSACPVAKSTVWECLEATDCPGGQLCCASSSDGGTVSVATDTCGPYLSKFDSTHCAAACGTGELTVCEQDSDCTAGTCTAVKPKGNDVGICN